MVSMIIRGVFELAKTCIMLLGVGAVVGLVVCAVEEHRAATAQIKELDRSIEEFLAVQPRTTWPEEINHVSDADLLASFVEGIESHGRKLTIEQKEAAKHVVVPRLKEQMARSIDNVRRTNANPTEAELAFEMLADQKTWSKRYGGAIAVLLALE